MKQSLRERFYFWLEKYPFWNARLFKYHGIAPSGHSRYVHKKTGHVVLMDDEYNIITIQRYRGVL